jgi:hypothetical protein
MTPLKKPETLVLCLVLFLTGFTITLTKAIAEDNYKNDNRFLTNIYESTLAENGYKTNIIINPNVIGIYATENGYKLDLAINTQGVGGSIKENNYRLDLIPEKTFLDIPDVAVTNIATSRTVVAQGFFLQITVTTSNKALKYETFAVVIEANTATIKTQTMTLTSMSTAVIAFTWNTIGYARGNYTITATALPAIGETNTADNTLVNGEIMISKLGDLNLDSIVNYKDASLFRQAYIGAYNYLADFNQDDVINYKDASLFRGYYIAG